MLSLMRPFFIIAILTTTWISRSMSSVPRLEINKNGYTVEEYYKL